jgi:hypothetical protein
MRKLTVAVVLILATLTLAFAYNWKTVYIANETMVVNDTLAKVWIGKTYPAKLKAIPQDSVTFYIEGSDSISVAVKLLTYTVTGTPSDTITVGTKALGESYTTVNINEATIPSYIFTVKPLITITNSAAVKTKPIAFKTVMIYKEL